MKCTESVASFQESLDCVTSESKQQDCKSNSRLHNSLKTANTVKKSYLNIFQIPLFGETLEVSILAGENLTSSAVDSQEMHYSRIECIECGRFVKWGKAPQTIAKIQGFKSKVERLSQLTSLNEWQAQFVASVGQRLDEGKSLSPKQEEWITKIYEEVGVKS